MKPNIKYLIIAFSCLLFIQACSGDSDNGNSVPTTNISSDNPPLSPPPQQTTGNVTVTALSNVPSVFNSSFFPPAEFTFKGRQELNNQISSAFTNHTYTFHVYLPPEYEQDLNARFPVLFFTDGEWYSQLQFRIIDSEARPIIAIGIEHDDRRGTDYVIPGAQSYHSFLVEELVPFIQSQYRVLDNELTLKGDSGGGSQTLISMMLDDHANPVFKYHMAFDPFISGVGSFSELIDQRDSSTMNKTLVITGMRGGFHSSVSAFVNQLETSELTELNVLHATYDLNHQDATWASFSNALAVIYGPKE